ncbi:hypothetical protein MKX03_001690 [Papaver bracteatum]|nr:hypothetical protein MKX03_001690 [Papaver bracteatum]
MDSIHDVTRRGDVESLRRILTENPTFPLADPKFTSFLRTPLHVAAMHGYVDFASHIIKKSRQLAMEEDSQGCTPLHLASTGYNVEMVRVLIKANPNACVAPDKNGGTPLHLAAMTDEVKVMKLLIQSRPDAIHQRLLNKNETILHLCVKHNNFRAMKMLVDYLVANREDLANNPHARITVNSIDSDGNTILHLAAKNKQIKMLKHLIGSDDIGVDMNIQNNDGKKALHLLDRNEMIDIGMGCICYDYHDTCEVPQQTTASQNERIKGRLNTIMIVAALIACIAFQAVINPPGGVFQEDSKVDSITDPVMFTYYLKSVIGIPAMSEGFKPYISNLMPPQKTTRGNVTASDDEIFANRVNFVEDLLTAADNSESLTRSVYPFLPRILAPGIVLTDDWWMNITSNYNSTIGGGSRFSPYLIRYAGTAIFAYKSPKIYQSYILLNSLSLLVCGLTILVVTFHDIRQRPSGSTTSIVGYLEVLLAIAVVCISISYTLVLKTIGPPFYEYSTIDTRLLILLAGFAILPAARFTHTTIYFYSHMPLPKFLKKFFFKRCFITVCRLWQYALDQPVVKAFSYRNNPRINGYMWLITKFFLFYIALAALLFGS